MDNANQNGTMINGIANNVQKVKNAALGSIQKKDEL